MWPSSAVSDAKPKTYSNIKQDIQTYIQKLKYVQKYVFSHQWHYDRSREENMVHLVHLCLSKRWNVQCLLKHSLRHFSAILNDTDVLAKHGKSWKHFNIINHTIKYHQTSNPQFDVNHQSHFTTQKTMAKIYQLLTQSLPRRAANDWLISISIDWLKGKNTGTSHIIWPVPNARGPYLNP